MVPDSKMFSAFRIGREKGDMEISNQGSQKVLVHYCLHENAEWQCIYTILDETDSGPVSESVVGVSFKYHKRSERKF